VHVRVAPEGGRVRLKASLAACCCFAMACAGAAGDVTATWTVEPTPPSVEVAALVRCALEQRDGTPVIGARLRLDAHMTHPGMAPIVGDLIERSPGIYESRLKFSMAGSWVLVVSGELVDGRRIVKQTEVTAVQPSG
jgi:hypothetical protein